MNIDEYKEIVSTKIMVLNRVNQNLLAQYKAIKAKDTALLGKLLKRQQGNIDKLKRIGRRLNEGAVFEKDAVLKHYEAEINMMLKDAIQTAAANIESAETLKVEIGNSIYKLKINGNAIKHGYLNKAQPRHGYFIDKRK